MQFILFFVMKFKEGQIMMLNIKRKIEKLQKDFSVQCFNHANCKLGTRTHASHGFQDGSVCYEQWINSRYSFSNNIFLFNDYRS